MAYKMTGLKFNQGRKWILDSLRWSSEAASTMDYKESVKTTLTT